MLNRLNSKCIAYGMAMHVKKTKVMVMEGKVMVMVGKEMYNVK